MNWVSIAKRMRESGVSVVPIPKMWIDPDNKDYKYPWKKYQTDPMTPAEVEKEFAKAEGIAIVCGAVSGNLVTIDFDSKPKYERWKSEMLEVFPELFSRLVIEETPSGFHVYVRCAEFETVPGNEKWAYVMRDKAKYCTIETRGEGGIIFCYPTLGYKMAQGKLLEIPTISFNEFEILKALAISLDEVGAMPLQYKHHPVEGVPNVTGTRPGDIYNQTVSWDDLFPAMGATVVHRGGKWVALCRPGKKKGTSGTTGSGRAGQDFFKCFSSNWPPFEGGGLYDKFSVFTILFHGGDFKKAAKAAAEQLGLIRTVKTPLKVEDGGASPYKPTPQDLGGAKNEIMEGNLAKDTNSESDWHGSDIGNAEQFAEAAKGKLLFCHELKRWVQWTGKRWDLASVGNSQAVSLYLDLIAPLKQSDHSWWAKCMSAARMRATIATAADFSALCCSPADFDTDPMILNTQDGIVHLGTGELIPHDPKYLCSKITACGVSYSEADEAVVARFIAEICGDDEPTIDSLQRLLGYSITGHVEQQKFVLAVGKGRNGKGTLTNTLEHLLGEYAVSLESETILSSKQTRSSFDLEMLRGARFLKIEEPDSRRMLDREFIKKLVGGDSMVVSAKYGHPYTIRPKCKLWLISNHKPRVEFDYAFERRTIVFPFTLNLSEEDVDIHLESKLIGAGGALLTWIINGSVGYHEAANNKLLTTERMRGELASYKEDNDNLQRFLSECTEGDDSGMVVGYTKASDLVHSYNEWAKAGGTPIVNRQELLHRMKLKGYELSKVSHNNVSGYKGLVLLSEGER